MDPVRWTVNVVGIEQVKELDKNAVASAEKWRNNPAWKKGAEVLHIDVKDQHAVVVERDLRIGPVWM